jgi:hypothetical protein
MSKMTGTQEGAHGQYARNGFSMADADMFPQATPPRLS